MNSTTRPRSYPGWIPKEFQIPPGAADRVCKSPGDALLNLGIYNIVTIVSFLVTHNQFLRRCIGRPKLQKPWSFVNVALALPLHIAYTILSSYFTNDSTEYIWNNIQIWAVRPRVTWFKGNMAQAKREWGYMNSALTSIWMEVFICAFSTYMVGSLLTHTMFYAGNDTTVWYMVMKAACVVMIISTAFEALWAIYMIFRFCHTKGRGEPEDMDALKWIAKTFVPVTCICSWLIWTAYLYSAPEAYCPARPDYITAVWIVAPFLTDTVQLVADRLR